jgi:hypothetical protein
VFQNRMLEEYLEARLAAPVLAPNTTSGSFSLMPSFHVLFLQPVAMFNTGIKQHGRYSIIPFYGLNFRFLKGSEKTK